MKEWTEGQLQGINASGENVLVSASAGTGKTAVLVERLIRLLTDPTSPLDMDRFVFVTFTNAAAQEMQRRVRQGIEELVRREPDNRGAARQRLLLGQAAISTLHGFCLDLIRRNYQELGIDPESRILSEAEQILTRREILEQYLEECYEINDPGFAALTAVYGGEKSDDSFKELILKTADFAVAQPRPFDWLADSARAYREGGEKKMIPALSAHVAENLDFLMRNLEAGREMAGRYPALIKYAGCLAAEGEKLRTLRGIRGWDALVRALEAAEDVFGRLPSVPTKPGPDEGPEDYGKRLIIQAKVKAIREKCKKEFQFLRFSLAGETRRNLREETALMAPALIALASLTEGFCRRYDQEKTERAVMDFGDIEHYALRLLSDGQGKPSGLALGLRARYEEILVDEYQDINPVQEAIIQALRGKRLFMVGDVKQSIYGFRQAAPRLFLHKFRRYGAGKEGAMVTLRDTFRGSRWVVEGINQVFDYCLTTETGGIDYRGEGRFASAVHIPEEGRPPEDPDTGRGALELHLIDLSSTREENPAGDDTLPEPGLLQTEALFCAGRIEGLMAEELWDPTAGLNRPVCYSDIVILLPAVKAVAEVFVKALQARNIPVYADVGGGYYQAQEVQTALNFLKVLDNPRQDIPLAAVMLSPAFGFTPEDLAGMKAAQRKASRRKTGGSGQGGGLYKALLYAALREEGPEGKGFKGFLKLVKEYRAYARRASAAEVLTRFYEDTGFLTISAAMAGGVQRRANLLALIQRAREFEETSLQGLYQYIKYLEAMEKRGIDLAPAPVIGEGENVVRIMSIHRSKGLEFPVVMLATAGRGFNLRDSQNDLLLHETWGMASKIILADQRVRYAGAYHRLVAAGMRKELIAEELRLLYVALTRAEQRVIVVAGDRKGEQRFRDWGEAGYQVEEHAFAGEEAASFMDWLGPAVLGFRGGSRWVGKLWPAGQIQAAEQMKREGESLWPAILSLPGSGAGQDKWAYIGEQLEWRYPRLRAAGLGAKLSVTQARGRLYPDEDPEAADAAWKNRPAETRAGEARSGETRPGEARSGETRPAETRPGEARSGETLPGAGEKLYLPRGEGPRFIQDEKILSPEEKGTLLHRILARIQPQAAMGAMDELRRGGAGEREAAAAYLDLLLKELVAGAYIAPEEAEQADRGLLIPFLLSGLFRRMALADARGDCRQEASFIMAVPAGRVYPGLDTASAAEAGEGEAGRPDGARDAVDPGDDDQVVLQGTIDVFFTEGDRLILADYKSDRISPDQESDLLRRYRGQLLLYAEGLEAFTGKKVAEMMLYSLFLGKEIPLIND